MSTSVTHLRRAAVLCTLVATAQTSLSKLLLRGEATDMTRAKMLLADRRITVGLLGQLHDALRAIGDPNANAIQTHKVIASGEDASAADITAAEEAELHGHWASQWTRLSAILDPAAE